MFKKIIILVSILVLSCNVVIAQQKLPTLSFKQDYKRTVDPRKLNIFGVTVQMPYAKADKIIANFASSNGYKLTGSQNDLTKSSQVYKSYENPTTKERIVLYGTRFCNSNDIFVRGIVYYYDELPLKDRQAILIKFIKQHGTPTLVKDYSPIHDKTWRLYWFEYKSLKEWQESESKQAELNHGRHSIGAGSTYFRDICLK